MKVTRTGRVVYDRPTHRYKLKDVVRIMEALSNTMQTTEKQNEIFQINAGFEIWRTAFYPVWQRELNPAPEEGDPNTLWSLLEPEIRKLWKDGTKSVIAQVATAAGVPPPMITFFNKYLTDFVWNIIWKITDPFFK